MWVSPSHLPRNSQMISIIMFGSLVSNLKKKSENKCGKSVDKHSSSAIIRRGFYCADFHQTLKLPSGIAWKSPLPNFIQIGRNIQKWQANFHSPLSEVCFSLYRFSQKAENIQLHYMKAFCIELYPYWKERVEYRAKLHLIWALKWSLDLWTSLRRFWRKLCSLHNFS